jgi:hypothetical protein
MKARLITFGTVLVAIMMIAGAAIAGFGPTPSTTDGQELANFADGSDAGEGVSHLTRTSGEALIVVEAEGLNAGEVHTLWWIVFNNPSACVGEGADEGCGEDDIFLEPGVLNVDQVVAARIAIGNATGNVSKSDGTIELGARLQAYAPGAAQADDGHQILFVPSVFGGVGNNLLTVRPNDAEIHVIVQGHGQARGGPQILKQLSEVDYGCTPNCVDLQAAVHAP